MQSLWHTLLPEIPVLKGRKDSGEVVSEERADADEDGIGLSPLRAQLTGQQALTMGTLISLPLLWRGGLAPLSPNTLLSWQIETGLASQ